VLKGGRLYGPWRRPRNLHNENPGSIHDDATAQTLGFRGGTVAGNIHFEMLAPLLLEVFGPRWFERGTLSIDFKYATVDLEEVRGVLDAPLEGAADMQVNVLIERPEDVVVGVGTASVGDCVEQTCLAQKELGKYDAGDYSILERVLPGEEFPIQEVTVPARAMKDRMRVMTEPLPWYAGDSPWGGPIASPTVAVPVMATAYRPYLEERGVRAVGLYSAIEVRHVDGPIFVDRPYLNGGRVLARGQSPKTEYIWYESYLEEMNGRRISEMLMQLRFMKGSASLLPQ
jgi:hypothetical protein